jgi:glycosyltransferase involved in cell wall biosynthesis
LVEPENIHSLAKAIDNLIEDDLLRNKIKEGAIESVKKYNPDSIIMLWEKLIQE